VTRATTLYKMVTIEFIICSSVLIEVQDVCKCNIEAIARHKQD